MPAPKDDWQKGVMNYLRRNAYKLAENYNMQFIADILEMPLSTAIREIGLNFSAVRRARIRAEAVKHFKRTGELSARLGVSRDTLHLILRASGLSSRRGGDRKCKGWREKAIIRNMED